VIPATIPLFPLPGAVVFPGVAMPLHIFEPRYRAMVEDALAGDRVIGMILLRPGYEKDYEGRPPVFEIGCAGRIARAQRLDNGRFNIVLQGIGRFRVLDEDHGRAYRVARIEPIPEPGNEGRAGELAVQRERLLAALIKGLARTGAEPIGAGISDAELVNGLAQGLDLEPLERQALLECGDLLARCAALADLLEMKAHQLPAGAHGGVMH
jgi:Lon protease-like protein